ncbi:undecaprenyldiphospho-muramoylpentapeptide beta-N-acetylglucosaminyltransferase [Beggiatoa leptomitoformis]|uniref:UDP-N-acetylglucosamine--N-acetylmuramyl-(pentapeptide) pyrophosphoryl-undecaprenol N-acetylglucosamine transferase n=1 Tax=Beggiatoa leptomitoformis TaxID=288004 RepID=A0A2N9YCP6_9GAMM|nr:undecaprenyldiphospho-muramoylpentapeptide beta-N-acetylglucosaminyltransferase [Beggiatoa leptomitoformis]ALG66472.2 undecaprenyldiphospho-muramoylpentapeptide beta-N-acetylglucosaminyltransferase [Beggiatoa leptomitoformis]AUI68237.2 undecaprenyldiphospho-muramoylpentapeptide beta-N-acetylglucosaminyltransferase [Beggiatoa leptomitoformis]
MDRIKTGIKPILLMAGGTGGHVFPALAIAERLRQQNIPVRWIGTAKGLEAKIIPSTGIAIDYIDVGGLRGKGLVRRLTAPFQLSKALWQSIQIMRRHQPAAVVGMGGFVTGPAAVAAWLLRIPVLIHEQNAIVGLTNRLLSRIATCVMEAFPYTFPASVHAIATGNPLRDAILQLAQTTVTTSPILSPVRILIVGGSLGAKALNEIVPQALLSVNSKINVWHQTGEAHFEATRDVYATATFDALVEPFITDMSAAYQWADLVICRAGALTVCELAQAGKASILVPYPHAVDDHQTANARFLSHQNAAILVAQSSLKATDLTELVQSLVSNPTRLMQMSEKAWQLAHPTATDDILQLILQHAYPSALSASHKDSV